MARPRKEGYDQFPLSVNFFTDKKHKPLKARFGADGLAVYLYLQCEIYRNGYYLPEDEDLVYIIADDLHISPDTVDKIMDFLYQRDFLDAQLHREEHVLSSREIQRGYQNMIRAKAMKNPVRIEKYWLLSQDETEGYILFTGLSGKNANKSGNNQKTEADGCDQRKELENNSGNNDSNSLYNTDKSQKNPYQAEKEEKDCPPCEHKVQNRDLSGKNGNSSGNNKNLSQKNEVNSGKKPDSSRIYCLDQRPQDTQDMDTDSENDYSRKNHSYSGKNPDYSRNNTGFSKDSVSETEKKTADVSLSAQKDNSHFSGINESYSGKNPGLSENNTDSSGKNCGFSKKNMDSSINTIFYKKEDEEDISSSSSSLKDNIKKRIGYEKLTGEIPEEMRGILEEVVNLLEEAAAGQTCASKIRIGQKEIDSMDLKKHLDIIGYDEVKEILNNIQRGPAIRNPRNYLLTALYQADLSKALNAQRGKRDQPYQPQSRFNNFPQREYDFEKLEEQLIKASMGKKK